MNDPNTPPHNPLDDDPELANIGPIEDPAIPVSRADDPTPVAKPNYGPNKISHVPPLGPLASPEDSKPTDAVDAADPGAVVPLSGGLEDLSGQPGHKIRAFEQKLNQGHGEEHWKRAPAPTGTNRGAVHVRSFHCKLTGDSLEFLDNQINDWLDAHPHYEVKMVTTSVGEWTGKLKEPALIVNVWV